MSAGCRIINTPANITAGVDWTEFGRKICDTRPATLVTVACIHEHFYQSTRCERHQAIKALCQRCWDSQDPHRCYLQVVHP